MRVLNVKINSSVVKFNLAVILVTALSYATAWITGNQDALSEILTPNQLTLLMVVVNIVTIFLRNTNLKGLPPIERVSKNKEDEEASKK